MPSLKTPLIVLFALVYLVAAKARPGYDDPDVLAAEGDDEELGLVPQALEAADAAAYAPQPDFSQAQVGAEGNQFSFNQAEAEQSLTADAPADTETVADTAAPAASASSDAAATSGGEAPAASASESDLSQNIVSVDSDPSSAQKRSTDGDLAVDKGEAAAAAKRDAAAEAVLKRKQITLKLDFGSGASGSKSAKLRRRFPSAFCELERDNGIICPGIRRGSFVDQFYFDPGANRCFHYVYNGCGGNANRFSSLWECTQACARKIDKNP